MGSIAGHVIPGIFFLLYGLKWSILAIWLHLSVNKNKKSRRASMSRRVSCLTEKGWIAEEELQRRSWLPLCVCSNFPLEPILKIVLPSLGVFVEAFLDYSYGYVSAVKISLLL